MLMAGGLVLVLVGIVGLVLASNSPRRRAVAAPVRYFGLGLAKCHTLTRGSSPCCLL